MPCSLIRSGNTGEADLWRLGAARDRLWAAEIFLSFVWMPIRSSLRDHGEFAKAWMGLVDLRKQNPESQERGSGVGRGRASRRMWTIAFREDFGLGPCVVCTASAREGGGDCLAGFERVAGSIEESPG